MQNKSSLNLNSIFLSEVANWAVNGDCRMGEEVFFFKYIITIS